MPVGGNVSIRPATGTSFKAEISMKKLQHVGLFTISANTFKAAKEAQKDFYGLTIPLNTSFSISESGRDQSYESSSAHLLSPGRPFNLTAKRNCNLLVGNFFVDPLSDYSRKLLQSDSSAFPSIGSNVSFYSQAGSILLRSIANTWSALNHKTPSSKLFLKELEDDLFASFVLYSDEGSGLSRVYNSSDPYHLNRAEEYICENLKNPILRDHLAELSSCSIRTLSRAFKKKYGIGPMAYIKQRRLDAAYLDLLSAKPDVTTVTQVAFNYGFAHIGKFAIEYSKTFGESPSTSLLKK